MSDLKTLVKNKRAVLFDMDGTLVNTEPLHAKAAVRVLESMGITIDLVSTIDQFYGMTDYVVLKTVCPQLTDEEVTAAIEEKNRHLVEIFRALHPNEKEFYLTPGLIHFLKYLKQHNIKCAVVSASEDVIVQETLECFELLPFMELHMGRNQTTLTKPHPDPYIEGMRRLGVTPDETLIFEDSPTGLMAARLSHADVVRVVEFLHTTSTQELDHEYTTIKNFNMG